MAKPDAHIAKKAIIPDDAYFHFSWLVPFSGFIPLLATGISSGTISIATLWVAIYFCWGFKIIPNMEYVVIERFGQFSRIVHSGPRILCLPGLIDKIAAKDTLRWRELALFADEKDGYKVDFKDGSSPVDIKASVRIGPQGSLKELDEAIYFFTYAFKDDAERRERIEDVLESTLVPKLQSFEIAEALVKKDDVATEVNKDESTIKALKSIGIELNPEKGIVVSDIALTPEIIAQRQKKLEGDSEAAKQKAQGLGYARSINAIKAELSCTTEEAVRVYSTQRGLETLEKLESNVSFVAPDMNGVLKTMGVGDANPRNRQPKRSVS